MLEGKKMKPSIKQKNGLIYFTQTIGILFVIFFLTAYFGGRVFGGLSSTTTLNSDPNFVFLQSVIGVLFIVIVIVTLVFAVVSKQKD
jgi:hypothetical protein